MATLIDVWWVQLVSVFAIAPVFVVAQRVEHPNRLGLMFFAAWIVPSTLWFYSFMPIYLAFLASVGWVFLMATLFFLFGLKRLPSWAVLLLVCVIWAGWTFCRLRIPVVQDWWLPHLGYAIWRNVGILNVAHVGGEAMLEFVVLLLNGILALLWTRGRTARSAVSEAGGRVAEESSEPEMRWKAKSTSTARMQTIAATVLILALVTISNYLVERLPAQNYDGIVSVQSDGDFAHIMNLTTEILEQHDGVTTVVWPENHLSLEEAAAVASFARENNLTMAVNLTDRENHNVAAMYDASGKQVLTNLKYHMAPGEEKTAGWSANSLDGTTAYTCYDVHYVDIVERIGDSHRVFILLNDSDFASAQKTLHKADMAFRAVQTRADIAASSIDGPTAFIDRYGRVIDELAYDREGYIAS